MGGSAPRRWSRRRTLSNAGHAVKPAFRKEDLMLWTIAVILIILWLLGLVSSYTMGGFIHILLVIAIVVILVRVIQGRTPL